MSKNALVVKADLTAELIDIAEQELSKLQAVVDGYIEAVHVKPNIIMWVNEEGLLREDLAPNHFGSTILSILSGGEQTLIRGDVVFTGGADSKGNTLGLTQEDVSDITFLARQATEALSA